MLIVTSVMVEGFTLAFLDVTWTIAETTEDTSRYSFTVQRSESPAGPFEAVSQPLVGLFAFRDKTPDLFARWRVFYYRLLVKNLDTGDVTYSPVDYQKIEPDRVGLYISEEYQLLLKIDIGTPCLIYKRRTSGPPCPKCYDYVRQRHSTSDCETCFNSRYRGGYMNAIPVFINFSPDKKTTQISATVQMEPGEYNLDMAGYPLLQPGDVIVDRTNKRLRVVSVDNRDHAGFTHRQVLRVSEIDKSEIFYSKFKIDVTLFPLRNGPLWPLPDGFGELENHPRGYPEENI